MDWNEFFTCLFWFLVAIVAADIIFLNGLFCSAVATRIVGKDDD